MSQVNADVDLSALRRSTPTVEPPRRGWLRILLPLGILLAFGGLLFTTLDDVFTDGLEVTVVQPTRAQGAATARSASSKQALVQASGWVEPDPFAVHVAALTGGVVSEVLVQESDVLEVGDPVALMVDDDARIALDARRAELGLAEAELSKALAESTIAHERFDAALEVTEALQVARANATGSAAAAQLRAAAVAEGEATLRLAEDELIVQRALEDAGQAGIRQIEIAEAEIEQARAKLAGLRADAAEAVAAEESAKAKLVRAERDMELRFDDRLALQLGDALLAHAGADVRKAEAALEQAELRMTRMRVTSPVAGVVLQRLTQPGMVLSVETVGHAVCSVYDPSSLRVRVDVPQADVVRLFTGQRAEIVTQYRDEPYGGEVIRMLQMADIQKVTLQVHVRILDPDEHIKPEMLCQVRFFGGGENDSQGGKAPSSGAPELVDLLLVPSSLAESGRVWVFDPVGESAAARAVKLGAQRDGMVEVLEGLNLSDKLIDSVRSPSGRAALTEGAKVRLEKAN